MDNKNLSFSTLVGMPPPPKKFTQDQWYYYNTQATRINLAQQALGDQIRAESDKVMKTVEQQFQDNERESTHKLEERISEIEFLTNEVKIQRKAIIEEIENLELFVSRIKVALQGLSEKTYNICTKCILMREGRIGIDLVYDDVQRELEQEITVVESTQNLLKQGLLQASEQVRLLRSTLYLIDHDLEDKNQVLDIDRRMTRLTKDSLNLSVYHGFTPMDMGQITNEEWELKSYENIEKSAKEINCAVNLRSFIDALLRQVIDDLRAQNVLVQRAFERRIAETKDAKTKLEILHSENVRQANEMIRNITKLEIAIEEKESYMALAHTRLGNRCHRTGVELCKDVVETTLANEVRETRNNMAKLQQMLAESQASLRYLLKTQIQIEEDINIKLNTLKIDEVDCMTLRRGVEYTY